MPTDFVIPLKDYMPLHLKRPNSRQKQPAPTYAQCERRTMLATFTGTAANDSVFINIGTGTAEVILNGTSTMLTAPESIELDGLASASDSVTITRPADVDAVLNNGPLEVGGFSISFDNFELLSVPDGFVINGTDGDDVFDFSGSNLRLNGSSLGLPSTSSMDTPIIIDGGSGEDLVAIGRSTAQGQTIFFTTELNVDSFGRFSWRDVEKVNLVGRQDDLLLTGTDGDDVLTFSENDIVFEPSVGPTLSINDNPFSFVRVVAGAGNDTSFVELPVSVGFGNALFTGSPTSSSFNSAGQQVVLEGFDRVVASGNGFRSAARITGSSGDDTAIFENRAVDFRSEFGSIEVSGFGETEIFGGGGNDTAKIVSVADVELDTTSFELTLSNNNSETFRLEDFSIIDPEGEFPPTFSGSFANDDIFFTVGTNSAELTIAGNTVSLAPGRVRIDGAGGLAVRNSLTITPPPAGEVVLRDGEYHIGDYSLVLEDIDSLSIPAGLTVAGTEGDDTFVFDFSAMFLIPERSLNGSDLDLLSLRTFPTPPVITIDGEGGTDRIVVTPRSGSNTVTTEGLGDEFAWRNVEEVELRTPSSNSFAFSYDFQIAGTDGDDQLNHDSLLTEFLPANGPSLIFPKTSPRRNLTFQVTGSGGNDVANLTASGPEDVFAGTLTSSTLTTTGPNLNESISVNGFDSVNAVGTEGGESQAVITGSVEDERATFSQGIVDFSGETSSIEVSGFDETTLSGGGGVDTLQSDFPFDFFLFQNDVFENEAATTFANSGSGNTNFRFEGFLSYDQTGDRIVDVGSLTPDQRYQLDHSVSPAILRRSGSPVSITAAGFTFHTNVSLSIIAPESEPVTLTPDRFSTPTTRSDIIGVGSVVVQGHNDGSEIMIEDIETLGFDTPGRLNFNGENVVLTTEFGSSLSATGFNSINVNSVGEDLAFLKGAEGGGNTFVGSSTSGTLTTPETTITVTNFDLVTAIADGANNVATLVGTQDAEQFFVSPTVARIEGSNFTLNASNFGELNLEGNGDDHVNITDSAGDDRIVARPNSTEVVYGTGQAFDISGISNVRTFSSTGDDIAILSGSAGVDRFVASDRFGRLSGDEFSLTAVSYPKVIANGQGGDDDAFLSDSPGDDSFFYSQSSSNLSGSAFSNTTINFEAVHGLASEGNDTAQFRGSENAESFFASSTAASLTADDSFAFAGGFDTVRAASGGGNDTATLRDSEGDDIFTSDENVSTLRGAGFQNQVFGFAQVIAISTTGTDRAIFQGTSSADEFFGNRLFSFLERDGSRKQANGFEEVFATGLSSSDSAVFLDSEGDDTFVGRGNVARLTGDDYLIQVSEFENVTLLGTNGGTDRIFENTLDYELDIFGTWS